jgi:hypothetical protein
LRIKAAADAKKVAHTQKDAANDLEDNTVALEEVFEDDDEDAADVKEAAVPIC